MMMTTSLHAVQQLLYCVSSFCSKCHSVTRVHGSSNPEKGTPDQFFYSNVSFDTVKWIGLIVRSDVSLQFLCLLWLPTQLRTVNRQKCKFVLEVTSNCACSDGIE